MAKRIVDDSSDYDSDEFDIGFASPSYGDLQDEYYDDEYADEDSYGTASFDPTGLYDDDYYEDDEMNQYITPYPADEEYDITIPDMIDTSTGEVEFYPERDYDDVERIQQGGSALAMVSAPQTIGPSPDHDHDSDDDDDDQPVTPQSEEEENESEVSQMHQDMTEYEEAESSLDQSDYNPLLDQRLTNSVELSQTTPIVSYAIMPGDSSSPVEVQSSLPAPDGDDDGKRFSQITV